MAATGTSIDIKTAADLPSPTVKQGRVLWSIPDFSKIISWHKSNARSDSPISINSPRFAVKDNVWYFTLMVNTSVDPRSNEFLSVNIYAGALNSPPENQTKFAFKVQYPIPRTEEAREASYLETHWRAQKSNSSLSLAFDLTSLEYINPLGPTPIKQDGDEVIIEVDLFDMVMQKAPAPLSIFHFPGITPKPDPISLLPRVFPMFVEAQKQLFNEGNPENLGDVTLQVRGTEIYCSLTYKAHSFILAARSKYFNELFSTLTKEAMLRPILIENQNPIIFGAFIEYLYTGKLDIDGLWEILQAKKLPTLTTFSIHVGTGGLDDDSAPTSDAKTMKERSVVSSSEAKILKEGDSIEFLLCELIKLSQDLKVTAPHLVDYCHERLHNAIGINNALERLEMAKRYKLISLECYIIENFIKKLPNKTSTAQRKFCEKVLDFPLEETLKTLKALIPAAITPSPRPSTGISLLTSPPPPPPAPLPMQSNAIPFSFTPSIVPLGYRQPEGLALSLIPRLKEKHFPLENTHVSFTHLSCTHLFQNACDPKLFYFEGQSKDYSVIIQTTFSDSPPYEHVLLCKDRGDRNLCFTDTAQLALDLSTYFNPKTHGGDITLVFPRGENIPPMKYQAHRGILAAASPYFKAILTSGMKDSLATELTIDHCSPAAFHGLLQLLYTGHLTRVHYDMLKSIDGSNEEDIDMSLLLGCDYYNLPTVFLPHFAFLTFGTLTEQNVLSRYAIINQVARNTAPALTVSASSSSSTDKDKSSFPGEPDNLMKHLKPIQKNCLKFFIQLPNSSKMKALGELNAELCPLLDPYIYSLVQNEGAAHPSTQPSKRKPDASPEMTPGTVDADTDDANAPDAETGEKLPTQKTRYKRRR